MQHLVARQHLRHAGIGFAAFADGGEELVTAQPRDKVDVSMNGIELQDREFFAAIREGREPNASVAQVLPCYQVLHDLELQLNAG